MMPAGVIPMNEHTRKPEDTYVDEEERELSQSLERGEWQSADDFEHAKAEARRYAEATLRKDRRMNVRMSERDLRNLKVRAAEEGVQYQTLVTMILHKYISGDLVERERAPNRSEGNVT
jgi:predicted DNA binding CopG/RHH family protein